MHVEAAVPLALFQVPCSVNVNLRVTGSKDFAGVGVTGCGSAVGSAARNAVAIDRTLKPELGTRAKQRGVEWAITLDITPDELVAVIYDAASGLLEQSNVAQE